MMDISHHGSTLHGLTMPVNTTSSINVAAQVLQLRAVSKSGTGTWGRGRGTPGRGDSGTRGRGTRGCGDAEILLNHIVMRENL